MTDPLLEHPKEELVALIRRMVALHPDLKPLLEAATPVTVDLSPYRTQLSTSGDALVGVAYGLVQTAHTHRSYEGYASALGIYELVLQEVTVGEFYYYHRGDYYSDGPEMWEVFGEAAEGLIALLAEQAFANNDEYRKRALFALLNIVLYDVAQGGIDLAAEPDCEAAIVRYARTDDVDRLRKAITHAANRSADGKWARSYLANLNEQLGQLEGEDLDAVVANLVDNDLALAAVSKLLQAGRADEAEELAHESGYLPGERYELVQAFEQAGHKAKAAALAKRYVNLEDTHAQSIQAWLAAHYEQAGDTEDALDLRLNILFKGFSWERYQHVKRLAEAQGVWDATYERIQALFRRVGKFNTLIKVYMLEGDWDAAWDVLPQAKEAGWGYQMLAYELAEKGGHARPQRAIELLVGGAREYIGHKKRDSYATAASLLTMARPLYKQLGKTDEFEKLIAELRAEFPRHRALQDELNKAGL